MMSIIPIKLEQFDKYTYITMESAEILYAQNILIAIQTKMF